MKNIYLKQITKFKVILAVVIILLSIFILWSLTKKTKADFYKLRPIDLNYSILSNCVVDYPDPLDLIVSTEGDVKSINFKEGSFIKKGQTIITLDDFNERQNLIISLNTLRSSELKLQNAKEEELPKLKEQLSQDFTNLEQSLIALTRLNDTYKAGGVSKADLEYAENNYKKALAKYNQTKYSLDSLSSSGLIANQKEQISINSAQYQLAKRKVDDKIIISPFDGYLLKLNVQVGQKVKQGTALATIIEKKSWMTVINVDQKELPFLRNGQKGLISLDSYPEKKLNAEIVYIGTQVSKEKGTVEVRFEIKDKADFVKHGMTGSAEIIAAQFKKVNAVPGRFIKKQADGNYIIVWNGKNSIPEKVIVRQIGERWKIIESNINEGTIILDASGKGDQSRMVPGNEVKSL